MPFKNGNMPVNAIVWNNKMIQFLKNKFFELTNKELAEALGFKITAVRIKCYELGLKRMDMEYWNQEQIDFLISNYQLIGDKELAVIFNTNWLKLKGWSHKHIEKKRRYLHLKRSPEEINAIKVRNTKNGCFSMCPVKAWDMRGRSPEGTIRYWKRSNSEDTFPVIKTSSGFIHWGKWQWMQVHGTIPKNMNVVFKDGNNKNLQIENLILISNGDLAKRNSQNSSQGLSDNYLAGILSHKDPAMRELLKQRPDILDFKRQQLILNRTIYEQQNND